jgi:pimeloyl-ACP methyl ester carboxylesterase
MRALLVVSIFSVLLAACASNDDNVSGSNGVTTQAPASLYANAAPLDLRLSSWPYPYPVKEFKTSLQGQSASMAYMDVPASGKQKGVVLLFHGKNFSSDYWAPTIAGLTKAGYRVIAPDQIGFGKSSKPNVAYHFDDLAANTQALLKSLGVRKVAVIANSMGGMVGIRFARLYPQTVQKLVLENPLGL